MRVDSYLASYMYLYPTARTKTFQRNFTAVSSVLSTRGIYLVYYDPTNTYIYR